MMTSGQKTAFSKPPFTYAEQIDQLIKRGMTVSDKLHAIRTLEHTNYYRLGAYWLPFELNHNTHQFNSNTTFDSVYKLYCFDKSLRLLLMEAVETIEVSVRAKWAYTMAHRHGAHSHMESSLAKDQKRYKENLDKLNMEVVRSRHSEIFIQHFDKTYCELLPPVWVVSEVMSFGMLSKWYQNLSDILTREAIAANYKLGTVVFGSWLQHLTHIRNTCAHHSRLWNRSYAIAPKTSVAILASEFVIPKNKTCTYNSLIICLYLLDVINPPHDWRTRLKDLLTKHQGHLNAMGFPADWHTRPIWQ